MQIADQIVAMIHRGQLKAGAALPGTRELSGQLGVSRDTVSEAYDRLVAEGYIATARAKGTFVRPIMAEDAMSAGAKALIDGGVPSIATNLPLPYTARGLPGLYEPPNPAVQIDFRFGRSDPHSFPVKIWRRLLLECLGQAAERLTQYDYPSGLPELRELIADFLGPARGITTTPDSLIVVGGFQQGINLAAHLLVGVNTPIVIEAPCYRGAAFLFESYGGKIIPVPILCVRPSRRSIVQIADFATMISHEASSALISASVIPLRVSVSSWRRSACGSRIALRYPPIFAGAIEPVSAPAA